MAYGLQIPTHNITFVMATLAIFTSALSPPSSYEYEFLLECQLFYVILQYIVFSEYRSIQISIIAAKLFSRYTFLLWIMDSRHDVGKSAHFRADGTSGAGRTASPPFFVKFTIDCSANFLDLHNETMCNFCPTSFLEILPALDLQGLNIVSGYPSY